MMEIKLSKKESLLKLNNVVKTIKGGTGIYENVLCTKKDGYLELIATDAASLFETRLAYISCPDDLPQMLLPLEKMIKVISYFKGEEFELQIDNVVLDPDKKVKTAKLKVKCGRNYSNFVLADATEFVIAEKGEFDFEIALNAEKIQDINLKISSLINQNHVKVFLRGVLFDITKDYLNIVGSDGVKVGHYRLENQSGEEKKYIVPYVTFAKLTNFIDGDVKLKFNADSFSAESNDSVFSSALINAEYVAYDKLFPAAYKFEINVDKDELLNSIDLVRLSLVDGNMYCKIILTDKKLIFDSVSKSVEIHQEMETDYEGEFDFVVNPLIIQSVVKCLGENIINIKFNEKNSPFLISNEKIKYLLMPAREK